MTPKIKNIKILSKKKSCISLWNTGILNSLIAQTGIEVHFNYKERIKDLRVFFNGKWNEHWREVKGLTKSSWNCERSDQFAVNFGMALGRLNLILMLCRRRIEQSEMEKALTFLVTAFVIAFITAKPKACCERSSQLRNQIKRISYNTNPILYNIF